MVHKQPNVNGVPCHQITKINTLPAAVTEELHACMCKYASILIKVTRSTNSVRMRLLFQHFLCNMKQHPTLKLLTSIRIFETHLQDNLL